MATLAHDYGESVPLYGNFFRASAANKRRKAAEQGLKDLGEVSYTAAPQLTSYYSDALRQKANPEGLSAQELAVGRNRIAGASQGILQHGREIAGGGFSQALNASINAANMSGINNLAELDAQRRFGNQQGAYNRLGSAVNQFQDISNRNIGIKFQTAQALGQAMRDARIEKQQHLQQYGKDAAQIIGAVAGGAAGNPAALSGLGNLGGTPAAPVSTSTPTPSFGGGFQQTAQNMFQKYNPQYNPEVDGWDSSNMVNPQATRTMTYNPNYSF